MNFRLIKQLILSLLGGVVLLSFSVTPEKANFAGSWAINEGKSENFSRFMARKLKVEQKEDAITIARTSTSFNNEEATSTETLSFDGKTSESTVFGNSVKKSTVKWTDDKSLTITYTIAFERNGQTFDVNGTETWTLGADGKSLTLVTVTSSPQGDRTSKAVYDKE